MPPLAQELGENSHYSVLLRKARGAGFGSVPDFVRLAVARGCRHYAPAYPPALENDPGIDVISNEELVALLLLGSNEYDPIAIRCAAQMASRCDGRLLSLVAKRERISRQLAYIAKAGSDHDSSRREFWTSLLDQLGKLRPVAEGILPHWSRFVSQTGVTRSGPGTVQWLHCQ
jgi:hypothetical protein